jgi:hypothetical protein
VAGADALWAIKQDVQAIVNALSGFDADADPNDAIANLQTIMDWAEANKTSLEAMEPATPTTPGFMSSAQAAKLAGVESQATKNTVSTDPNANTSDTVPSSSALYAVKQIADAANIPEMSGPEAADPALVTDPRKFSPSTLLDLMKNNVADVIRDSLFQRTVLIPGVVVEQTYPGKIVVPTGTYTGRITVQSSITAGSLTLTFTHSDNTTVSFSFNGEYTVFEDKTMKGGDWTVSISGIIQPAAEDLTIYVDLVKV